MKLENTRKRIDFVHVEGCNKMKIYHKKFSPGSPGYVTQEADFLKIASDHVLSPKFINTDNETYIDMEDLDKMSVGDMYGNDINEIPEHILAGMFSLIWTLYHVHKIEYLDVWPRNFIEKDGRVWIIDFGDAKKKSDEIDDYLGEILAAGKITHSNPEFL